MWYFLKVRNIPIYREKSKNHFFRRLSKGNLSFYGYTNKSFFKDFVDGGLYRTNVYDKDNKKFLEHIYYLRTKQNSNKRIFELNLKSRLHKMGCWEILLEEIDELNFISIQRTKFYQPFGSFYFNKP